MGVPWASHDDEPIAVVTSSVAVLNLVHMARVRTSGLLGAIAGQIDGYVFKTYRGRTILTKKPAFTSGWSKAQKETRKTFKAASDFSETIKADPELLEAYKAKGRRLRLNYRQMALRDAFNPPSVDALDVSRFKRDAGGTLAITASDDFAVTGVSVAVMDTAGRVLANGEARYARGVWHFDVPSAKSTAGAPASAVVTAHDRPGNVTTRTFPLA